MDSSKQTTLLAFNKKVKSPYTLQYLEFQERLKGNNKRPRQKLPALTSNPRKSAELKPSQDYLGLAHELIQNKERIWFAEDKENRFPTLDSGEEVMNNIKEKITRIKNRTQHQHLHPRALQQSQQLTKTAIPQTHPKPLETRQPVSSAPSVTSGLRSRVRSEAVRPPTSGKVGSVVTFLQYKKSKRELSMRLRRQANQR